MYIVDFARNMFKAKNIGIIVYLVLNTLIFVGLFGGFSNAGMAVLALLLYLVSVTVALSPLGEWILRLQNGCKKIKRKDYLERLMPLFDEVYARARQKDPSIPEGVQLYMSNDAEPNAFATGRKTVCVTKGFLSYTDDQIKGTLAHEFGHLAHKDTDALLLITVGNMLMSAIFVVYRVIVSVIMFIVAIALDSLATLIGRFFIDIILVFLMWCWTKIGLLLVMHSSRQGEFEADKFAFELGYGNDLAVVLDSFAEGASGKGLWASLHSTHPDTNDRIARLQELGASFHNAYGHSVEAINTNPQQYGYSHGTPPVLPPAGTGYRTPPVGQPYSPPLGAAALTPMRHVPAAQQTAAIPPRVVPRPPAPQPGTAQQPVTMPPRAVPTPPVPQPRGVTQPPAPKPKTVPLHPPVPMPSAVPTPMAKPGLAQAEPGRAAGTPLPRPIPTKPPKS